MANRVGSSLPIIVVIMFPFSSFTSVVNVSLLAPDSSPTFWPVAITEAGMPVPRTVISSNLTSAVAVLSSRQVTIAVSVPLTSSTRGRSEILDVGVSAVP